MSNPVIKHQKHITIPDGSDTNVVRPSDWNADHEIEQATGRMLGRIAAGTGPTQELTPEQSRTVMALGTAAIVNVGTSVGNVPAIQDGGRLDPAVIPAIDDDNRVINGDFSVWQRGTSLVGGGYLADRWATLMAGGTVTNERQAFPPDLVNPSQFDGNLPRFYSRMIVSGQTLASHFATRQHRIEGVRSYAGQTITVLGYVRREAGSGNVVVEVGQSFGTGGSPSADIQMSPETIVISTTGVWIPFAATFAVPDLLGKTLGTDNNDFLAVTFWSSAGSNFNARTNSLGLQTITVDLWGIHIRRGVWPASAANLYRPRQPGVELALCQRYFCKTFPLNTTPANNAGDEGALFSRNEVSFVPGARFQFPTPMRDEPSITLYNPQSGASGQWNSGSNTTANAGTFALSNQSVVIGNTNTFVSSGAYRIHVTADAEL